MVKKDVSCGTSAELLISQGLPLTPNEARAVLLGFGQSRAKRAHTATKRRGTPVFLVTILLRQRIEGETGLGRRGGAQIGSCSALRPDLGSMMYRYPTIASFPDVACFCFRSTCLNHLPPPSLFVSFTSHMLWVDLMGTEGPGKRVCDSTGFRP